MPALETLYWAAAACVAYPYAVYPAWLAFQSRVRPRPVRRRAGELPSLTVVLAAHDEAEAVARRVREFRRAIVAQELHGAVVVVSDGSTDDTAEAARRAAREGDDSVPVTVLELTENRGKAAALTAGCLAAGNDVLALADSRQTWEPDALTRLLENFADPDVGAVGGELLVEAKPGVMAGVGLYWRFEKWMRRSEGLTGSTVGVTGAICAVRRELFRPIPDGTILDDVYWPLDVVAQGYRVVFDGRARALDRLPDKVGAEFRRKVRTLSGNFQLVARRPEWLSPRMNPAWFAFVSHKLARLLVPWALIATFVLSAALGGPIYGSLFVIQSLGTLLGLSGLHGATARRSKLASAGASFLVLNAAAWVALWVWASGRAGRSWTRTTYAADRPALVGGASR